MTDKVETCFYATPHVARETFSYFRKYQVTFHYIFYIPTAFQVHGWFPEIGLAKTMCLHVCPTPT